MDSKSHFTIISSSNRPSPAEIADYLEGTWEAFHDLFAVEATDVKVVISLTAGSTAASSGSDSSSTKSQETISGDGDEERQMAWSISEGENFKNQTFSDLSHEIAHIYFLDYMQPEGGLHQSHAWLHEAVAIYHEREPYRQDRLNWIRDRIDEYIPLEQLFTMKNPVKLNPLVELTAKLHEKLHKKEISMEEVNKQISAYASSHSNEIAKSGENNMTYYAESFSIFMFLLETEGKSFIREFCLDLKAGKTMNDIIRRLPSYSNGIVDLETAWLKNLGSE